MGKKLGLSSWMIIALIAGIIVGAIFNAVGISGMWLRPFGDIFIKLVKMLVVPLLITTIVTGTCAMNNMRKLGRVAVKALVLYIGTMLLAMVIGVVVANIIKPGAGLTIAAKASEYKGKEFTGVLNTLVNLVPSNVVDAMAKGQLLPLILFSVFMGACISALGMKGKGVMHGFKAFS